MGGVKENMSQYALYCYINNGKLNANTLGEAFWIDKKNVESFFKTVLNIWEAMKERSFLNYNVDIKEQDKRIDEFKTFSLNQQKQLLLEMLNKNQLYVNLSEIDDTEFKISDDDKQLNQAFYGERR